MLQIVEKRTTIEGKSVINNIVAENYSASINSNNPEDISFSTYQVDKEVYKANRAQCRKDRAEFEDMAYTLQDQMIKEEEANASDKSNSEE